MQFQADHYLVAVKEKVIPANSKNTASVHSCLFTFSQSTALEILTTMTPHVTHTLYTNGKKYLPEKGGYFQSVFFSNKFVTN
jgi:valyl-tRNA synthetase